MFNAMFLALTTKNRGSGEAHPVTQSRDASCATLFQMSTPIRAGYLR